MNEARDWLDVIEEYYRPEYGALTKAGLAKAMGTTVGRITRWMNQGWVPFTATPDGPRFDLLAVHHAHLSRRRPGPTRRRRRGL